MRHSHSWPDTSSAQAGEHRLAAARARAVERDAHVARALLAAPAVERGGRVRAAVAGRDQVLGEAAQPVLRDVQDGAACTCARDRVEERRVVRRRRQDAHGAAEGGVQLVVGYAANATWGSITSGVRPARATCAVTISRPLPRRRRARQALRRLVQRHVALLGEDQVEPRHVDEMLLARISSPAMDASERVVELEQELADTADRHDGEQAPAARAAAARRGDGGGGGRDHRAARPPGVREAAARGRAARHLRRDRVAAGGPAPRLQRHTRGVLTAPLRWIATSPLRGKPPA